MRPIQFELKREIPQTAAEICAGIADLTRWADFEGYGPLPGIERATYEKRTVEMAGSRIRVRNRDGSEHLELIERWNEEEGVLIILRDFSPPLNRLATHFTEEWRFERGAEATLVRRRFELFPRRPLTRPLLWIISLLFRRAVARHLAEMGR